MIFVSQNQVTEMQQDFVAVQTEKAAAKVKKKGCGHALQKKFFYSRTRVLDVALRYTTLHLNFRILQEHVGNGFLDGEDVTTVPAGHVAFFDANLH